MWLEGLRSIVRNSGQACCPGSLEPEPPPPPEHKSETWPFELFPAYMDSLKGWEFLDQRYLTVSF
jgi:hypothetical protein